MTDLIAAFIDHMRAVDCAPENPADIVDDDKFHYYRILGDDPKTKKGSYVLMVDPDGFAVGGCQSFRNGVWHKFISKTTRKATPEQRAEWKAKQAAAKAKQDRERAKQAAEAAEKAIQIWRDAAKTGTNAYLTRKGFSAEEIGCRVSRGKIVVPMWRDKKLVGLQFIDEDGGKLFLKGSSKEGAYHAIKGDGDLIVIGEGLATCAAVHRVIGCTVVIAFDAGNLKPVAQAMRGMYPDKRFAIAADHDAWTIPGNKRPADFDNPPGDDPRWDAWRDADLTVNTGRSKAIDAAGVFNPGAWVVHPPIPMDDPDKRTDFWDVLNTDGPDAIKAAFENAMNPPEQPEPEWEPDYAVDDVEAPRAAPEEHPIFAAIRPLGYDQKRFYFFPKIAGQIMDFTGPALANMQNLATLAPPPLWEAHFGGGDTSEKKMVGNAAVALIAACMNVGIYNPENERRVGVWMDDGVPVFNAGNMVYYPGGSCRPQEYKSKAVYVAGPKIGELIDDPLSNAEAAEFLKICMMLAWKQKTSGYMLAGFVVTAMIGGALRWRSHIVVTGEKGAGKTWVVQNIIKEALGMIYLGRDGGTTEASLRQDMSATARPIIMDEAESETASDRIRMEGILGLLRKASSGSTVANFTGIYPLRSAACLAAINPRVVQGADLDRMTMLHMVKYRGPDAGDRFKDIQRRVAQVMTADFSARLLARSFANMHTILKNIETFSEVLETISGSKRFGDQHGTLAAGAFSLTSTAEITYDAARDWCSRQDWNWALEDNDQTDSERLLAFILASRVRYDDRGMVREANIGGLVYRALNAETTEQETAIKALGEYGIKADREFLIIASPCIPMTDLLKNTAWGGSYRRALSELPGAVGREKIRFNPAMRQRGVAIPMSLVLADMSPPPDEEIPFEDFA